MFGFDLRQAQVHPDRRGGMGMHYTSVTNIMKVIERLAVAHLNLKLSRLSWSTDRQPISFMPAFLHSLFREACDLKSRRSSDDAGRGFGRGGVRRRWSHDEMMRIVEETPAPDVRVTEIARRRMRRS
jgi:hypothetical protein